MSTGASGALPGLTARLAPWLRTAALLLGVFLLSRTLVRALPGDPVTTILEETGLALSQEELRAWLGLDRPYLAGAVHDFKQVLFHGDFGRSFATREPIGPVLPGRILNSLLLGLSGTLLALAAALPLGIAAGAGIGLADAICRRAGALLTAFPAAWTGPILAWLLGVRWFWLPPSGHLALPALTLALGVSGFWMRLVRARVRETLLGPGGMAATAARARGLPEFRVALKYGFAPALPDLAAYFGTQLGGLIAGSAVIEVLFDWPGMGSLFVDSVLRRDYPLVEACAFTTGALALLGTRLGDWLQFRFDPRLNRSDDGADSARADAGGGS